MSSAVSLQQRLQQLKKLQTDLPKVMSEAAQKATMRAIEAASDATPPKAGTGRGAYIGTNSLTGELKAHWAIDSDPTPKPTGDGYTTILANNMEYASYVNDGHRMDRHFVPGLYINPGSGLLEYDPSANVGIVVGTKTAYVKGEFMTDKGIEAYRQTIQDELEQEIRRLMK